MFRSNQLYQQPALISSVNELPEKPRRRLEASWAGTFRAQFLSRVKEEAFAVLSSDIPSRPNVPVNVLVSLDTLKAGHGWSDEEFYDHFLYDLQVRYAVGYGSLTEGDFELRVKAAEQDERQVDETKSAPIIISVKVGGCASN
jgi:hypothetical protein